MISIQLNLLQLQTQGNATDFGDRTVVGRNTAGASSSTRVVDIFLVRLEIHNN